MPQLAVRAWGDHRGAAPSAVLVHGITSSARTWWRVGPALAERGYRVLAVDLRGHGASPRVTGGVGLANLVGDMVESIHDRPVDLLVGHSLGALTAMALLGVQPQFARRVVLEEPPGRNDVDWAGLADGVLADTQRAVADPKLLRKQIEADNPGWTQGDVDGKLADLLDCDAGAIADALRRGLPFDPAVLAANVEAPSLLVLADEALGSYLVGEERRATIAALPRATVRVLPTGHSPHREAFEDFMGVLDAWLAETS